MKIAVAGMGLIGGSLYKASLKAGFETLGLHHGDKADLSGVDIIFVALPPKSIAGWIEANESTFKDGAILCDVCGVKTPVFEEFRAQAMKSRWTFIPAHPMAGKEVTGFANADAGLFRGASIILTPYPFMGRGPLDKLCPVLRALGFGKIVSTTPAHHDEMIAYTSQLCHVISGAYIKDRLAPETNGYTAGSFADMSRIATMDEKTWSDLFLENKEYLLSAVGRFRERMEEFEKLLAAQDKAGLERWIKEGADMKRSLK